MINGVLIQTIIKNVSNVKIDFVMIVLQTILNVKHAETDTIKTLK